ncbi:hypothetical protein D9M71_545580 [compost metagenome]
MLARRIAAALAIGHRGHGRHRGLVQTLQGLLLLAGAEHRQLGGAEVLDDLAPADATVDLDEVAAPVDLGTQGAAAFQFAVDLALQALDLDEGVLAGPEGFEGFVQLELHRGSPS